MEKLETQESNPHEIKLRTFSWHPIGYPPMVFCVLVIMLRFLSLTSSSTFISGFFKLTQLTFVCSRNHPPMYLSSSRELKLCVPALFTRTAKLFHATFDSYTSLVF